MGCCSSMAQPKGKKLVLKQTSGNKVQDFRSLYDTGIKLGEGTFGMVYDCTKKDSPDSTVYAVKMLEHQSSWWGQMSKAAVEQWEGLAQECEMLTLMDHPNVIKLHDTFVDRHFLYFVMDKYESSLISSALPLLMKGRSVMPHCVIGEITAQTLGSIVYLHNQNIVHRDVKADNYLVNTKTYKATKFKVVLTDLGTARYLEDGVFLKDLLGTMQYWAPEVVARCYTHKVDCWAIGVVLWCMLTMKFPFNTAQEAYTKKLTQRKDRMTTDQFELITMLLEKNPLKRVPASLAMEHKFVVTSVEKHAQMIAGAGADDAEDKKQAWSSDDGPEPLDANEKSFGDVKKAVASDVQERRQKQLVDAQTRFEHGENDAVSLDTKITQQKKSDGDAPTVKPEEADKSVERQRVGEAKQYSWWSDQRCRVKDVPDITTVCTDSDGAKGTDGDNPAQEEPGDMALTEPSTVEELTEQLKYFKVDISKFGNDGAKTIEDLFIELEGQDSRLVLRGGVAIRVVDLLALRIKTPKSDKILIEAEVEKGGKTTQACRLPAVMRQAGGSGLDRIKTEIDRMLNTRLNTNTEVVSVNLADSQQEQTSYKQDSKSYPSLTTVYRKTVMDAVVNMKAPVDQLNVIGLPSEEPCSRTDAKGSKTTYRWMTEEELKADASTPASVVSFPKKTLKEFEGLTPLSRPVWTEENLKEVLQQHNIDISKFGVGTARSIKQFVEETNSGETHLLSDGSKLRRHLDILVVKIKSEANGAILIETGHTFGKGQSRQKNALPATKVRPFEDKVWAARRLLSEVDIPYSSSRLVFGPVRVEKSESPSYPGVITVYVKQVMEVQLMEIDVANLGGDDMGRDKWFSSPKVLLDVKSPRCEDRGSFVSVQGEKVAEASK